MGSLSSFLPLRRLGASVAAIGATTLAWGMLAAPGAVTQIEARLASTGPPCGAGELCIKESQVPTTATAFSGGSCGDLVSAHPDEDLWHFVIPDGASFSTDTSRFTAIFSNPDGTAGADSIGGPNDKFAFVYSAAGATLTWAFATGVTGTPVQPYFVLSGTCPASQSSSSSSSSSSTTVTGSVSGTSSATSSNPSSGVQGLSVTTPNTGSGGGAVFSGLVLLGGGVALMVAGGRRIRRRKG